jgi:Predicted nucleotide-binding protein containing TIR-like domain
MARKSIPSESPKQAALTIEQMQQAIPRLRKRIEDVEALSPDRVDPRNPSATTEPLEAAIKDSLARTFGHDTVEYRRFEPAAQFYWPMYIGRHAAPHEVFEGLTRSKQRSLGLLGEVVRSLEERLEEVRTTSGDLPRTANVGAEPSDRIFIVHGHDEGAREAVARFVTSLGLKPIILHEQANQGRTIIEKVEDHGAVGFAVVLLTPDDEGRAKGTDILHPRARQNVIAELGYFVARLGRDRVCALVRDSVEIPSDFSGVVYEKYDDPADGGRRLVES